MNATSLIALIVPVLVGIVDMFSGQITTFVAAHPGATVLISALSTILAALSRSVLTPKQ